MNAILGMYTDLDELTNLQCYYLETLEKCERLEKELLKSRTMSKSFEALQKHAINLELDLQQYKERIKNDKSFKENQSNVFLKEREQYFEIQDLKAQLQDKGIAINSLEKKDFSKSKSVTKNNVSNDFSKPVTAQILPQNIKSILKNTSVIAPGMYKVHTEPNQTRTPQLPQDIRKTNKRVSFSKGVIPTTSVSRPQLKRNRMGDRVLPNNSQGKKIYFKFDLSMMGELKFFLGSEHQSPRGQLFETNAFSDSDHAGCLDAHRSDLCLSRAEYVSLSACCAQVLWLRTQLTDYGFHFDKIPMYCDSKAAIAISCNPVQHSRYSSTIDLEWDLFTKALSEDRFKYLVRRLGMRCLTPDELEVLAIESA
ncbi:hypothetical protein Tco_0751801 [Tanacetum coccineum]|uniref:Retrovirus-related Pol polyprotein from transposon TNT 1-94 n=1 Tax=Tanacetum coccineum TaxID=301880 RepID=A0ABQ4Z574_9ASTR